jgi:hypothetical protein
MRFKRDSCQRVSSKGKDLFATAAPDQMRSWRGTDNGRSHGHVCSQGAGLRVHGQFSGGYFESKV